MTLRSPIVLNEKHLYKGPLPLLRPSLTFLQTYLPKWVTSSGLFKSFIYKFLTLEELVHPQESRSNVHSPVTISAEAGTVSHSPGLARFYSDFKRYFFFVLNIYNDEV